MRTWRTKQRTEVLKRFPPFAEIEDYYDFYDHVEFLCKEHKVCLDEDGDLLDVDLDEMVETLLKEAI
ncbi:MAG: hypothetical protein PHH86_10140 [Sphaerochaetaceae bacterium]|nr:hypothetical protein [Sphaerochaetaceae bacterium]